MSFDLYSRNNQLLMVPLPTPVTPNHTHKHTQRHTHTYANNVFSHCRDFADGPALLPSHINPLFG